MKMEDRLRKADVGFCCGWTSGLILLCHFESWQQFPWGDRGSTTPTNAQHHKTRMSLEYPASQNSVWSSFSSFLLDRSEIKWRANGNSCLDFSPEKKTTVTFHLSHLSFTIDFIKSVYILNIISIFNHLICFYFKEILGETSGTVLLRK